MIWFFRRSASEHVANARKEEIQWRTNTGLSARLEQIRQRSAAARRSRMLSSQLRRDRRQRNRSDGLV
jgi:hypothetical protein